MKHTRLLRRGWHLLLLVTLALLVVPVWAQGQIYLRSVEPSRGRPGEELTLTLRGGGFGGATQVWVIIDDLQVWEAWVESDQVVGAQVFIPEGAPPGPRTVEVVAVLGQNEEFAAVLEGGFSVLESEALPPEPPGPEPRDEGDGLEWPWWLLFLGGAVVLLGGAALGVTVSLKVRKSAVQKEWQAKAQDQDLPKTCQAGSHYVRREKPKLKPGRWKVAGLRVTLYHSASGRRGSTREVPPELVDRVDKAARHKLLRGESEELAQQSAEMGRELAALVTAWQSLSEVDHDVYLQAQLEGGEASVKFILYRCVGEPGRWKKLSEWTAKLKAIDHLPSSFRGPRVGEPPTAYRALLEEQLGGYVYTLIQEAGRLL